jgi:hypothetical protein
VEKDGRARQATDDSIVQYVHCACWMTKVTDIHSEYVILLAFSQQKWICKHASMLCLYVYCISCFLPPPPNFVCGVVGLVGEGGGLNCQQQICEYVVVL